MKVVCYIFTLVWSSYFRQNIGSFLRMIRQKKNYFSFSVHQKTTRISLINHLPVIFISLFLLSSCSSSLQVEKSVNSNSDKPIRSLVSLNPDFEIITSSSKHKPQDHKSIRIQKSFFKIALSENATKNGIQLKMLNARDFNSDDASYFKELAPLKREIMRASYLQNFINNGGEFPKKERKGIQEFELSPRIATNYSYLAKKHGTPYFVVQGLTSHKKPREGKILLLFVFPPLGIASFFYPEVDTYYYSIVADVESSTIIYKEIRKVNQLANKSNMNAIIYDSYKIMLK